VAKAGRARKLVDRAVLYATVTAFAAVLAFPFYWMLLATFKTDHDLYNLKNNPLIFNDHPTLANLKLLFDKTLYLTWVWNTVIVGALVVVITLALALPAGYALARLTGKWGERQGIAIFLTYLVPSTLLFVPMSRIVATLGLQDTLWALVVVYPAGHLAFTLTIQEFTYALTFITSSGQHGRGADEPGTGRRLLLGLADGRVPDHQHPGGDPLQLQPLRRPPHLGLQRGRDQVVALRPRKNGLPGHF
jgi:ABC-type Fe3+ transport system permease subunit